jgi:hypothetical protein
MIGDQWLCRVCKALWVEIEFTKMAEATRWLDADGVLAEILKAKTAHATLS